MASSDSFDLPSLLKIFIYCVLGMVRRKHSVNNMMCVDLGWEWYMFTLKIFNFNDL